MTEIIDFESYPLKETVELLLADKTTKKHIIWAMKSYEDNVEFIFLYCIGENRYE